MSVQIIEGDFVTGGGKYTIVVGRFNAFVVESLLEGALDTLKAPRYKRFRRTRCKSTRCV